MVRLLFILLAIILPGYCTAQYQMSLSSGLAGFSMNDMKRHQVELKSQFPTNLKVIDEFPPFWFYELSATRTVTKRLRLGGELRFMSTGGHMSYRDYSGRIVCDQTTTAWTTAAQSVISLNSSIDWPIYFTGRIGAAFGRYDLDVLVEIDDDRDATNLRLNSINYFIEPGFMASKNITGPLSFIVNAGYQINVLKGKQRLSTNNELYLLDDSGEKVRLDWSGFRVSAGLSVSF